MGNDKYGGIDTLFKDAVMPSPGMSGDNVAQTNGADIRDGQSGTSRTMPEVTTVSVKDASAPGIMGGRDIKGS